MIKNFFNLIINPLASLSAGATALRYGDVNTMTPSPGEVKGLFNLKITVFSEVMSAPNFEINFLKIRGET